MSCKFRPLEPAEAEAPQQSKYMTTVRMGPRGQIVIPKDARELFGLRPGTTFSCWPMESGAWPFCPKAVPRSFSPCLTPIFPKADHLN